MQKLTLSSRWVARVGYSSLLGLPPLLILRGMLSVFSPVEVSLVLAFHSNSPIETPSPQLERLHPSPHYSLTAAACHCFVFCFSYFRPCLSSLPLLTASPHCFSSLSISPPLIDASLTAYIAPSQRSEQRSPSSALPTEVRTLYPCLCVLLCDYFKTISCRNPQQ